MSPTSAGATSHRSRQRTTGKTNTKNKEREPSHGPTRGKGQKEKERTTESNNAQKKEDCPHNRTHARKNEGPEASNIEPRRGPNRERRAADEAQEGARIPLSPAPVWTGRHSTTGRHASSRRRGTRLSTARAARRWRRTRDHDGIRITRTTTKTSTRKGAG